MNIDELQSVKSQERQSDTLQQLRASFYEDAGEFIGELREQRDRAAAEADDPFSSPEVQRLTDEIETAERTVEDIYDRRVGKLVKMASFAAADMPTDDEGLTKRERQLFERLVDAIEQNREHVLAVLDGEAPDSPATGMGSEPEPEPDEPGPTAGETADAPESEPAVGAADLMGDPAEAAPDSMPEASRADPTAESDARAQDRGDENAPPAPPEETAPESGAGSEPARSDVEADGGTRSQGASRDGAEPRPGNDTPVDAPSTAAPVDPETTRTPEGDTTEADASQEVETSSEDATPADRTTLRITRDVGEIMGVDERAYDLASEDVVTLPAANAEPLLQKDAAERLE